MAVSGLPVVLTDNGLSGVTPNNIGLPVTIVSDTANVVSNGDAREITVTGTYTDTVTFTVAGGVITEIALS